MISPKELEIRSKQQSSVSICDEMSAFGGASISNNQQLLSDSYLKKEQIEEIAVKLPTTITELQESISYLDDCDEYGERILNVIEACSDSKKYWCVGYKHGALRVLYNSAAELLTQD